MADDFTWMLGMHRIAARFGDGQKPELIELLSARHQNENVVQTLPLRLTSSSPAHQNLTNADLAAANILALPIQNETPAVVQKAHDEKSDKNTQSIEI